MNKADKTAGVLEPGSELGSHSFLPQTPTLRFRGLWDQGRTPCLQASEQLILAKELPLGPCLAGTTRPPPSGHSPGFSHILSDVLPSHSYPQFMPGSSSLSSPVLLHYNTHPKYPKSPPPNPCSTQTLPPPPQSHDVLRWRDHGTVSQMCAPKHHLLSLNLISHLNNGAHLRPTPTPPPAEGSAEWAGIPRLDLTAHVCNASNGT